jgi:hypothetical protein
MARWELEYQTVGDNTWFEDAHEEQLIGTLRLGPGRFALAAEIEACRGDSSSG